MSTLVLTSYPPEWTQLASYTAESMRKYCLKHGYDFHADCSDISERYCSPDWGIPSPDTQIKIRGFIKLDLMLYYLDPEASRRQYDYVCWLDADMMITNDEIPLEKWMILTGKPGAHTRSWDLPTGGDIVMPWDYNGFNATVILARNIPLVYDFLWACNNAGRKMWLYHDWAEMAAMKDFSLKPPYDHLIHHRSVKEMCSLPVDVYTSVPKRVRAPYEWERGDFAVHFSALSVRDRLELAKNYTSILATA